MWQHRMYFFGHVSPDHHGLGVTVSSLTRNEIFQLIKAHQENATRLLPIEEVRTILDHSIRGMLSTFSQKHEGYPSGSMVDLACDSNGSPIIAVSNLVFHTKELPANPKCSLLIAKKSPCTDKDGLNCVGRVVRKRPEYPKT
ncbi:hypothetical protein L2E82_41276 [Cichorium intybus]|uniref:Uncharacterized protein n=1 Tax=Cichorium intybus TaxID=13427 RepID=A0ACB9AM53_CICIN|nr:hypothetical protein L2E82_41276 [Cichorium intybus]